MDESKDFPLRLCCTASVPARDYFSELQSRGEMLRLNSVSKTLPSSNTVPQDQSWSESSLEEEASRK
eukprot:1156945-Pelagomonas_calceolata.AAC.5